MRDFISIRICQSIGKLLKNLAVSILVVKCGSGGMLRIVLTAVKLNTHFKKQQLTYRK